MTTRDVREPISEVHVGALEFGCGLPYLALRIGLVVGVFQMAVPDIIYVVDPTM